MEFYSPGQDLREKFELEINDAEYISEVNEVCKNSLPTITLAVANHDVNATSRADWSANSHAFTVVVNLYLDHQTIH